MFNVSKPVAYGILAISVVSEIIAASVTTASKGFTRLKPTLICILGYGLSYYFFGLCLQKIDLGIGYATWGAAGMVVTALVGYFIYHQHITHQGKIALVLIVGSIITLNLFGAA